MQDGAGFLRSFQFFTVHLGQSLPSRLKYLVSLSVAVCHSVTALLFHVLPCLEFVKLYHPLLLASGPFNHICKPYKAMVDAAGKIPEVNKIPEFPVPCCTDLYSILSHGSCERRSWQDS